MYQGPWESKYRVSCADKGGQCSTYAVVIGGEYKSYSEVGIA